MERDRYFTRHSAVGHDREPHGERQLMTQRPGFHTPWVSLPGPFRSPSRPGPVAAKAHPADTHPRLGWLCRSSESLSLVEGSAGRLRCSGSSDIRIGEAILVGDPLSVPRAVPRVPPGQADSLVFGLSNAVLSFSRTEQGFQPVTRPPGQPRPTTHRRARPLGNAGGLEQDGLYSIHP